MKNKAAIRTILVLCIPWILAQAGTGNLGKDEIQAINKAIKVKGAKWTAGENKMTRIPLDELNFSRGTQPEMPDVSKMRKIQLPQIQNLPSHFDWRNNNGNWVTPVKNQYSPNICESCAIFAVVAQTESWLKIKNGDPNAAVDLSEQFIVSFGSIGTCSPTTGFSILAVLDFVRSTGVPPEACMPYAGMDISRGQACPDWKNQCTKIPGWGIVSNPLDDPMARTEKIKNAVYLQPIVSYFEVQDDFASYNGGVYEPVWGNFRAGHMVLIIGWDDAEQCWICKNSWGEGWGDAGFFRVQWGACAIGVMVPIIWDSTREMVDFSIQPNGLDLSLTRGDTVKKTLTFFNKGTESVEYSAFAYEIKDSPAFHPDAYNSFDGMSLWSGDTKVNGYTDFSLQCLDLPCLNLAETVLPKLTFMTFWSVGATGAGSVLYDGMDGCNVWISTDKGKTFRVVPPLTPPYNCKSLYSYSYIAWSIGDNIPGWGGSSLRWKPAEVDLSPFKTDSVVVRFAFASDWDICSLTDPSMKGFFIDEIQVADGGTVLFENHGDTLADMKVSGTEMITALPSYREKVKWLDVSNEVGSIAPADSSMLEIGINTRNTSSGQYKALILLSYNNERVWTLNNHLPVHLELKKPEHDVGIDGVWPYGQNMPILVNENRVKIHNYGTNDEKDFEVVLQLTKNGQAVLEERAPVPLLAADDSMIVTLKPAWGMDTGEYDRSVSIRKVAGDYNAFNDIHEIPISLSNLLDDFESESGLWDYQGGWGVANSFKHSGLNSCHVNSGKIYAANADEVMTLKPALDVLSLKNAYIQFWTKYITQKDMDLLYVEASVDSMNWIKLDSLSGTSDWVMKQVDLSRMLGAGPEHLWARFHFQSDSKIQKLGVFIDDVEILTGPISGIVEGGQDHQPGKWDLDQNYPNPFNHESIIRFVAPIAAKVTLKVYDLLGREVMTIVDKQYSAGEHRILFDASGLSSGLYFYRIRAGNFTSVRKMVLLE